MATQKDVSAGFAGWQVEPDPDRYGTFVIPGIQRAQRHAACAEDVEALERRAAGLMQAAPDLYRVCRLALDWFRKASLGTLDQMEEALGQEAPIPALQKALRKAGGQSATGQVQDRCSGCGRTFPKEEPLQPIDNFWERVEAGDVVPSGECPECGGLCYLE